MFVRVTITRSIFNSEKRWRKEAFWDESFDGLYFKLELIDERFSIRWRNNHRNNTKKKMTFSGRERSVNEN